MQENAHYQFLIGLKLLYLIDWEGVRSFIDHLLGEVKLSVSLICWSLLLAMFWRGWVVRAKELRILIGSDFFQT